MLQLSHCVLVQETCGANRYNTSLYDDVKPIVEPHLWRFKAAEEEKKYGGVGEEGFE